jgi:GNAT superfamily N-acetyltransferase
LFKTLSPTTIYYRFFGALKELNPEMLARFTQIDYDREIALVAIDEESETDNMLGVARIIGDPDGKTGEFAVLVGDAWQGKGIGGTCWKNASQLPKSKVLKRCTASCCMRTGTCSRWGKSWVLIHRRQKKSPD